MDIAKKFILWTVVIIVFIDILTIFFIQSNMETTLSEELNGRGNFLVKHLAQEAGGGLPYEGTDNFSQLAQNIINADSEVKCVYLTDGQNNVIGRIYQNDFLVTDIGCDSSPGVSTGNIMDFKAQIYGRREGFAHVGMDRTSINETINNQTDIIIFNILIVGLFGILMAYLAGNYFTAPIRALAKGAEEIGKGNFEYKIKLNSIDDDIHILSKAFNQMSYDLNKNVSELRKLSTAVEEAPDGIQITDMNGLIIYSNKAMEKIFGVSPDEFKGKHFEEIIADQEFGSKVIIPGIKDSGNWVGEVMVKHKDKQTFPILLNAYMVKDIKGEQIAMVGIIKDISMQKEMDSLQNQFLQSEKLATIGTLAAGVAHELNNPLGNISLYAQMLIKKTDDEKIKKKLIIIDDEANRAANIVKDLLDFSRNSELKLCRIDINNEITKVLGIMNPQVKYIKVNTFFEPLPLIVGDSVRIQQVIMNLLSNSIQSITEKGEITIKTTAKPKHVEISISDNGCGIPEEKIDKIFDPFFTTKNQANGTGLGLSICYGIIKRHKGSIEVKSEVDRGTTFTIKLPV
ncbi:two-component system, NtrC family, sensor histidine kinase AtoS [Methanosarcinales archaeon]|nr:two-component system, NtrC family, sensor histidine kinase AtoS [Methanosarcinales archaeon]